MKLIERKAKSRLRRKRHVRKTVSGTTGRPRLTVFRSHQNIYAQIIDDSAGQTLVAASSQDKSMREQVPYGGNAKAAQSVGAALAERAIQKGIKKVVFDRNGYPFHGRIKALAEAARKAGLEF
jgi:large subunit ribosomal protein L18